MRFLQIMNRYGCLFFLCFIVARASPLLAQAITPLNTSKASVNQSGYLPYVTGRNLNGVNFELPRDLPAPRSLFLFAFDKSQSMVLKSWVDGLNLEEGKIHWIESPVMPESFRLINFFTEPVMRASISEKVSRDHIVPLYFDRENFSKLMGIEFDPDGAYATVVAKSGLVLLVIKGGYTKEGASDILNVLNFP